MKRGAGTFSTSQPPAWLELSLIVLLCFLIAGSPPPAVNEAHYLGKAKQYWNPAWCRGDFFLESADAHLVFYWTFGWLTQFVSLNAAAWTGRIVAWGLFAVSWRSLLRALTPLPWSPLLSAVLLLPLMQFGHLSGEWLVGGVEAKDFAYPLVFWAAGCAVERRWWCVWPLLGLAASFHVLAGGWAVVAFFFAWCWRRQRDGLRIAELLPWLVVGGICALPGLVPAWQLMAPSAAIELDEASRIYTFRRLAHHLVFQKFPWYAVLRFAVLCGGWWAMAKRLPPTQRYKRLQPIIWGSLLITACGVLVDFATGLAPGLRASLLRYYWFRLSDVFVPLGVAVATVEWLFPLRDVTKRYCWGVYLAAALALGWTLGQTGPIARATALQQQRWPGSALQGDDEARIDADWREVCLWIKRNAPDPAVFLTPTGQQTFKWYASRAEVVTWKDVPQDAAGLIAWWQRRRNVYVLGDWPWTDAENFANLVDRYRVSHLVWPRPPADVAPPPGQLLWENDLFIVYRLEL